MGEGNYTRTLNNNITVYDHRTAVMYKFSNSTNNTFTDFKRSLKLQQLEKDKCLLKVIYLIPNDYKAFSFFASQNESSRKQRE